jgi:mannosyl-3-phosphoglycerate phosphatase
MLALPLVVLTEPLDVFLPQGHPAEQGAEESLGELERRHVPLVFVSRGTRMEVEFVRRRIGNRHPFLTENGGGLFVPEGYFRQRIPEATPIRHYHSIALARPYEQACAALEETAKEAAVEVVGFHQMSAREVAENTGLPQRIAEMARLREYDEPFFFAGEESVASERLDHAARLRGWRVTRGERFWHFSAGANVGAAVRRLMELYRGDRHRGRMRSVAIGWSSHQLPLLAAAGRAILLPAADSSIDPDLAERLPGARRVAIGGIAGWNHAVMGLLSASA